jgi:hypothetical protein
MFMHEPPLVPNVEAGSDTRNVEAMRLLDRSLICVVLDLDCIEHAIGVIDEMNVIQSQEMSFRLKFSLRTSRMPSRLNRLGQNSQPKRVHVAARETFANRSDL